MPVHDPETHSKNEYKSADLPPYENELNGKMKADWVFPTSTQLIFCHTGVMLSDPSFYIDLASTKHHKFE